MGVHKFCFYTSFIAWYDSLGTQMPKTRWGMGLDHAFIMHFDKLMCLLHACLCLTCVIGCYKLYEKKNSEFN